MKFSDEDRKAIFQNLRIDYGLKKNEARFLMAECEDENVSNPLIKNIRAAVANCKEAVNVTNTAIPFKYTNTLFEILMAKYLRTYYVD